jgi:hypothetical protein
MKLYLKVLFLLLMLPSIAFSSFGKILASKGKVKLLRKGKSYKAKRNVVLSIGDVLNTGQDGIVVVKIGDRFTTKLNKNSQLVIESPVLQEVKKGSAFFSIVKKKLDQLKKDSSSNPDFKVKASSVAMGVRGTEFFVSFGKKKDVWMCVNEGKVSVKGKQDKEEVLVNQGEGVVIAKGNNTSAPKALGWTQKLNWNMSEKAGDLKNSVSIEEAYGDLLDKDYD